MDRGMFLKGSFQIQSSILFGLEPFWLRYFNFFLKYKGFDVIKSISSMQYLTLAVLTTNFEQHLFRCLSSSLDEKRFPQKVSLWNSGCGVCFLEWVLYFGAKQSPLSQHGRFLRFFRKLYVIHCTKLQLTFPSGAGAHNQITDDHQHILLLQNV